MRLFVAMITVLSLSVLTGCENECEKKCASGLSSCEANASAAGPMKDQLIAACKNVVEICKTACNN